MKMVFVVLLTIFVCQASAHGADKIRIGIPNHGAQFMTFPLAQAKGFLKEEGLEAEHIRIFGPVAIAALLSADLDYWGVVGALAHTNGNRAAAARILGLHKTHLLNLMKSLRIE